MTNIDVNAVVGSARPESLLARVTAALRRKGEQARKRWAIARDVAMVRAMGDELLRDIGLNRSDIEFMVHNGRLPDR